MESTSTTSTAPAGVEQRPTVLPDAILSPFPTPAASKENSTGTAQHLLSLDSLRAVAVLLVIARHVDFPESADPLLHALHRGGWVGVDLFFVLSGFLVSGLLFSEYLRARTISVTRFLVRRGLKIYPAFYSFLLLTVWLMASVGTHPPPRRLIAEVFFLQNYLGGLWGHTWSLAVEEHFYIGIALIVMLLLKRRTERPLSPLPWMLGGLAVALPVLRLTTPGDDWVANLQYTHLRIDSLGFGVLLSYFWHLHPGRIAALFRTLRVPALFVGALLLTPAFVWPLETTRAIHTLGLSAFSLGSGLILMALIANHFPDNPATRALAAIGAYSYSIYLWHMPLILWFIPRLRFLSRANSPLLTLGVACLLCVVVGVVAARIVEFPVLRLRDKYIPSKAVA